MNIFGQLIGAIMQNPRGLDQQLNRYGDPNTAYSRVQDKLNSGQMTQEQLNYIIPFAQQIYEARFGKR